MAMTLEDNLRWQWESASERIESLRQTLGDNVNQAALDAMAAIYREGWQDCWRVARLHGVEKVK